MYLDIYIYTCMYVCMHAGIFDVLNIHMFLLCISAYRSI